jgi:hypothetical protein
MLPQVIPNMNRSHALLVAAFATSLVVNIWLTLAYLDYRSKPPFELSDERNVEESLIKYGLETGQTRGEILKTRFSVAVTTPHGSCVNLRLRRGAIGWTPVYCYDRTGRLIHKGRV